MNQSIAFSPITTDQAPFHTSMTQRDLAPEPSPRMAVLLLPPEALADNHAGQPSASNVDQCHHDDGPHADEPAEDDPVHGAAPGSVGLADSGIVGPGLATCAGDNGKSALWWMSDLFSQHK